MENQPIQPSDYEIKKGQKLEEQKRLQRKMMASKFLKRSLVAVLIAVTIGGLVWYVATRPPVPETDIVSKNGLHWHPEITIYAKGEKQEIPANIGIGAVHKPIHTHDDNAQGIIHMEFQGLVRREDTTLGHFFENWGKDMRSFGSNMTMTVNGKENFEYENYPMKDKDKIEIKYE